MYLIYPLKKGTHHYMCKNYGCKLVDAEEKKFNLFCKDLTAHGKPKWESHKTVKCLIKDFK